MYVCSVLVSVQHLAHTCIPRQLADNLPLPTFLGEPWWPGDSGSRDKGRLGGDPAFPGGTHSAVNSLVPTGMQ